jgi:hypothetical protein
VKLGEVGVDSGGLIVMDPSYIKGAMQTNPCDATVCEFWGRDADAFAKILMDRDFNVEKTYHQGYRLKNMDDKDIAEYNKLRMDFNGYLVDSQHLEGDFVHKCFDARSNSDHGGQLFYPIGHAGLAVSFDSGLGDGCYEVWATMEDIEGWGERILKVEVILIDEKDLEDVEDE